MAPPSLLENAELRSALSIESLTRVQTIAAQKYPILNVAYSISLNEPCDFVMLDPQNGDAEYECSAGDVIYIKIAISRPWVDGDFTPILKEDPSQEGKQKYALVPNIPKEAFSQRDEESGWAVVGYQKSIMAIKRFPFGAWTKTAENSAELSLTLQASVPSEATSGDVLCLKILIISNTWIGSDQEYELKLRMN
ncbi:hypothetical protein DI09_3p400 [Mitosporidium daphniae]|uniref:Uncharacterized protein n=1 Tax=Mitosporidium daphniae TaxID=1485682 RepID=A0A098VQH8_9MICR|nr:uncharacterized protein DI09_3p400 [Mitosporidium daphniae]KGG51278.1 hypothetical protein DI09_3p400 [Mitosporidium daphniae]|eukprot:XP_013237705.1 uncharacterized protein DI09_3p400 [Mitosporidium daphniae]